MTAVQLCDAGLHWSVWTLPAAILRLASTRFALIGQATCLHQPACARSGGRSMWLHRYMLQQVAFGSGRPHRDLSSNLRHSH